MTEHPVVFACAGENLVGVLAVPDQAFDTAVLIVVGGPQYRAGSHRQFVQLARYLADAGVAVLRFDVRGMGDSAGVQRRFDEVSDDIAAAIDTLQGKLPTVRRIALWGLCDGASAALIYLHDRADSRVRGLVLLNPWVRTVASHARTQIKHYYAQRLRQRDFWAKALSGKVALRALADFASRLQLATETLTAPAPSSFQDRMASAWERFTGPILLVLSGKDYTAKEFLEFANASPRWRTHLTRPQVTRLDLPEADHTFSIPSTQRAVEAATLGWLCNMAHD